MGSGSWTRKAFESYTRMSKSAEVDAAGRVTGSFSAQDVFQSRMLHATLNPKNIMRECRDSEEHPKTRPVIIGLDVTGSMSDVLEEAARSIGQIMDRILSDPKPAARDVEFCVMAYGDLAYDRAPIQVSQFESDTRIAEHLDHVYFERGGGGNSFESTSAIWYMGARHCDLDCWKRGEKGLIITVGDEQCPPYLPKFPLADATGDALQGDINTKELYKEASEKYEIHHIHIDHRRYVDERIPGTFKDVIGEQNFHICKVNALADVIADIVLAAGEKKEEESQGLLW